MDYFVSCILCAIDSTEEELQDIVNRLHEAATELGMKINGKKTEVMKVCDDPKSITVTVAGCTLNETKSFKYLGAIIREPPGRGIQEPFRRL